jgi:hypothetical protein
MGPVKLMRRKSLLAVLLAFAAIAAGPALTARAETGVDGFTILDAYAGNMVHRCGVFGASGDYQAVVCVDINTGPAGDTVYNYDAKGTMELYCQTTGGVTVRCPSMIAEGVFADGGGDRDDVGEYVCNGNCPSGREYLTEGTYTWSTSGLGSDCDVSLVDSVWMVAYGGTSWVELPNGAYEYLGSNWSTGHYLICPN